MPGTGMPDAGMPDAGMPDAGMPGASSPSTGKTGEPGSQPGFGDGPSADGGLPDFREDTPNGNTAGANGSGEGANKHEGTFGEDDTNGSATGGNTAGSGADPIPGTRTTAEQVAILDAELDTSTGEFDTLILEAQREQRRKTRQQAPHSTGSEESSRARTNPSRGENRPTGGIASAGGQSTGGGMGSQGGGASTAEQFPPPADIPSGTNDDVLARQLREAATREPDPVVREKLWEEYRKYKGL